MSIKQLTIIFWLVFVANAIMLTYDIAGGNAALSLISGAACIYMLAKA